MLVTSLLQMFNQACPDVYSSFCVLISKRILKVKPEGPLHPFPPRIKQLVFPLRDRRVVSVSAGPFILLFFPPSSSSSSIPLWFSSHAPFSACCQSTCHPLATCFTRRSASLCVPIVGASARALVWQTNTLASMRKMCDRTDFE